MLETLTIDRIAESRRPGVDFNQLGFGNVFSDHMFSMVYTGGQWRQPEILVALAHSPLHHQRLDSGQ